MRWIKLAALMSVTACDRQRTSQSSPKIIAVRELAFMGESGDTLVFIGTDSLIAPGFYYLDGNRDTIKALTTLRRFFGLAPQPRSQADIIAGIRDTTPDVPDIVGITLLEKVFEKVGYSDQISLKFRFRNKTDRAIRAFTGVVVFSDLFDRTIVRLNITDEGGIRANRSSIWEGSMEYNQFIARNVRLARISQRDLQVTFEIGQVIYGDGTRENFTVGR